MSKYKIEKNIPIASKGAEYPLSEMEVGDSFEVSVTSAGMSAKKLQNAMINEARKFVNTNNAVNPGAVGGMLKFTTRTALDGQSVRCWRIR